MEAPHFSLPASNNSPGVNLPRLPREDGFKVPPVRRGLKRPAQHTPARSGRERKWARHCGCSGPCHAELFDKDDECEDLELEVLENLLKRRHSTMEFRGGSCSDSDGSKTRVNGSAASESGWDSSPKSASSPPQLLHFLMMF